MSSAIITLYDMYSQAAAWWGTLPCDEGRCADAATGCAIVGPVPAPLVDVPAVKHLDEKSIPRDEQAGGALAAGNLFCCPVCLETMSEFVTLGCGPRHRICEMCLCEYLKNRVSSGQFRDDQLVCPMPQCHWLLPEQQISQCLLQTASGAHAYERLQDMRAQHFDPGAGFRLLQCPTPDCAKFVVSERVANREEVMCPHCCHRFCPRCSRAPHGKMPCGSGDGPEGELHELALRKGWKHCPKCNALCERWDGCQFMECSCGALFCYLCGDSLKEADHGEHYSGFPGAQGPFGSTCLNFRKVNPGHRCPPGPPPAPRLEVKLRMGPVGERSAVLRVEWEVFRVDPPLVEYAVDLCVSGRWMEVGKVYDKTHLELTDFDVVPRQEYAAALRACNVNGWGARGAMSKPFFLDTHYMPALHVQGPSQTWQDVACVEPCASLLVDLLPWRTQW